MPDVPSAAQLLADLTAITPLDLDAVYAWIGLRPIGGSVRVTFLRGGLLADVALAVGPL